MFVAVAWTSTHLRKGGLLGFRTVWTVSESWSLSHGPGLVLWECGNLTISGLVKEFWSGNSVFASLMFPEGCPFVFVRARAWAHMFWQSRRSEAGSECNQVTWLGSYFSWKMDAFRFLIGRCDALSPWLVLILTSPLLKEWCPTLGGRADSLGSFACASLCYRRRRGACRSARRR